MCEQKIEEINNNEDYSRDWKGQSSRGDTPCWGGRDRGPKSQTLH